MTNFIKNFRADESGAVTVDWVVLTAATVGLAIAVIAAIKPGVVGVANDITTGLSDVDVTYDGIKASARSDG